MVWFGQDLKDRVVSDPDHEQEHLPLGQTFQSPTKPGLEHLQIRVHSFSAQPAPMTHSKEFLPNA